MRTGQGYDAHAFASGRKLVLGGVEIPHEQGLAGHSDADVLVHALIDALLGSMALGDLGSHFPSGDEQFRDADSFQLLAHALQLVSARGGTPCQVDCTVIAERPKLQEHIPAMRANLATALSLPLESVSVKATTNDGLGWIGRGEGIAALAVAMVADGDPS